MILFCPDCHRSFVFDDAEIAARGGPAAYSCDDCGGALTTMEAGLGLDLAAAANHQREMTHPDALALEDEDLPMSPDDQPTRLRPSFDLDALSSGGGGYGHTEEPTQLDTPAMAPAARPRLSPRLTGEHDIPADFSAMAHGRNNGPRQTGAQPAIGRSAGPPPPRAAMPHTHGAEATRQAAAMEEPSSNRKPLIFLGLGCAAVAGLGLILAIVIGLVVVSRDSSGTGDTTTHHAQDDPKVVAPKRPHRASFEDRILEASSAVPGTAVPAVKLPAIPEDGEVVVVGSNVWHDGKMIASVNLGRVEAGAKPNPSSPFIVPLGRSLEKAFSAQVEDPDDADAVPRWVLVLADGKAPYRALYEVMYTAANRGARIQLGTTNPMNPNAFLAVEVIPVDWPDAELTDVPESLPPRDPAAMVDTGSKAIVVSINDKGFTIRKAGEKAKEAVFIEKLMNSYPVSSLRQEVARLRSEDSSVRAVRIIPTEATTLFSLVQTIAACMDAGDNLPPLNQVRLEPPAVGK